MGLDQSAISRDPKADKEIADWCKHPNLQGWMQELWEEKGGGTGEFNSVEVQLTLEDLDELEKAVKGNNLPKTEEFFYGNNLNEDYKKNDLQFIADARKEIGKGRLIFYNSWW